MPSNLETIVNAILPRIKHHYNIEVTQRNLGNLGIARINEMIKVSSFSKLETFIFLSILEGEFYLKSCPNFIQRITEELVALQGDTNEELISRINTMFQDYKYLLDYISDRSKNQFQRKILNFELERKLFIRHEDDYTFFWLFSLNIKLAEIDEGYACDDETIALLLGYFHDLNIVITKDILTNLIAITSQLKVKCAVLLYKALRRSEKTGRLTFDIFNDSFSSKTLENELKDHSIGKAIVSQIKNQYFDYGIDMNSISKKISSKDIKITEVHQILKFIKLGNFIDEKSKYFQAQLKNLLLIFKNKLRNIQAEDHDYISQGNTIAYQTTINLISNTLIILETKCILKDIRDKYSFAELEKAYRGLKKIFDSYKKLENKTVPNFMLYKLHYEQLNEIIILCENQNKKVLNEEGMDYEKILPQIFNDGFACLKQFKEKLLRSKELNLMPLYLEIEECNLNKFFLDSQYILPSNYNYLLKLQKEYVDDLRDKQRILVFIIPNNIKDALKEVFKKEVKEHQYSVITIIGLYASFITFILANVSVLPQVVSKSLGAVFAFIIAIGVVLFFFVGTLKLLFSSEKHLDFKIFKIPSLVAWLATALLLVGMSFSMIKKYANIEIPPKQLPNTEVKK